MFTTVTKYRIFTYRAYIFYYFNKGLVRLLTMEGLLAEEGDRPKQNTENTIHTSTSLSIKIDYLSLGIIRYL